jgi:Domain of unknown function (DUF1707)/TM2 domain
MTMSGPPIRIGNDERQAAAHALGDHFAHGRLDADEYEQRVGAAYGARTSSDLDVLFADLPRPGVPAPLPPPPVWPVAHQVDPTAPYGREPRTGLPYSDRSKVIAGVLQIILPFGIGRFYSGHTGIGVAQLLLSFLGIGILWAFIDGIVLLAGRATDPYGRPMRT